MSIRLVVKNGSAKVRLVKTKIERYASKRHSTALYVWCSLQSHQSIHFVFIVEHLATVNRFFPVLMERLQILIKFETNNPTKLVAAIQSPTQSWTLVMWCPASVPDYKSAITIHN